jgi:hypothetical protein
MHTEKLAHAEFDHELSAIFELSAEVGSNDGSDRLLSMGLLIRIHGPINSDLSPHAFICDWLI